MPVNRYTMLLSGLSSNSSPIPPSSVLLNNEKSIIHVSRSIRTSQEPEDVSSYGLSFNVIKLGKYLRISSEVKLFDHMAG